MTKTKDDGGADLQSAWTTGHAAIATSANQAGIEGHADKLCPTSNYSKIVGQPFVKFDVSEDAQHKVIVGPTRAGMGVGPILPNVLDLFAKPKN